MLQKTDINLNDEKLLIFLGFIISIFPLCFLMGSFLINLNTILACIIFIIFLFKEKNFNIFKNKFFIILLFLYSVKMFEFFKTLYFGLLKILFRILIIIDFSLEVLEEILIIFEFPLNNPKSNE